MWSMLSRLSILFAIFLQPGWVRAGELDALTWFVQVSDLHLSRFAVEQMLEFGDKEGDFGHLASEILRPLQPGALVLTGDLVDGKTKLLRGQQHESEWKKYRRLLENATAAGIAESNILDMRGNHDVFDVARRGVPPDYFAMYAAAGRRNGTQRLSAMPLPSRSSSIGSSGWRLFSGAARQADACPAAVLLGVDLTPSPGLRGPTDFFGRADARLLHALDKMLTDLKAIDRQKGCSPVYVAAGHYPLSVVVHPDTARYDRPLPPPTPGLIGGDGTLRGLLAQHGVSAWLAGHLHGLFSQRQHLLHPGPYSGHLAELESTAWKDDRRFRLLVADRGVLSFADLYLNSPSKPKLRPPPAEPAADDIVRPATGPTSSGYSIVSTDPTQRIYGHIVVIASPAAGSYAPLARQQGGHQRTFGNQVRALVFPVGTSNIQQVTLHWWCLGGTAEKHSTAMQRAVAGQPLFTASIADGDGQTSAFLQVVVTESDGRQSTSEQRHVAVLQSLNEAAGTAPSESSKQRQQLAEPLRPFPTDAPAFARFVLWADMARFGTRFSMAMWLVHILGLLLLPKMWSQLGAASRRRKARLPVPHIAADSSFHGQPPATNGLSAAAVNDNRESAAAKARAAMCNGDAAVDSSAAGNGIGRLQQPFGQQLLRIALAVPLALQDMSTMGNVFYTQALYALYLGIGPWFLARFLSEAPLGVYFPGGVLLRPPEQTLYTAGDPVGDGWRYTWTPDTLILCWYHWMFTVLPGTLWLAWVLSGWRQRGGFVHGCWQNPRTRSGSPFPFTFLQALLGVVAAYLYFLNTRRLWRLYGPASILVSPGFGWTVPLAAVLLLAAWHCNSAAPQTPSAERWSAAGLQPKAN